MSLVSEAIGVTSFAALGVNRPVVGGVEHQDVRGGKLELARVQRERTLGPRGQRRHQCGQPRKNNKKATFHEIRP